MRFLGAEAWWFGDFFLAWPLERKEVFSGISKELLSVSSLKNSIVNETLLILDLGSDSNNQFKPLDTLDIQYFYTMLDVC